jgi:hypothetical protein
MKEKRNWNLIEARLNFEDVRQKLLNLSASGKLKRRKSAGDLLDKVKDALLKARGDGVSIAALGAYLTENGLPVSEPTLRNYLHAQGAYKRRPRRKAAGAVTPTVPAAQPAAKPKPHSEAKPGPKPKENTIQSLIDQRRAEAASPSAPISYRRSDGPHIADVKNL